tara:strand:- start:308 stop:562 length:255 start_codon:yes stop_codon:yes gene_type:complete
MSDITYGSKTMNSWTSQESVAPFIKAVVSDGSVVDPSRAVVNKGSGASVTLTIGGEEVAIYMLQGVVYKISATKSSSNNIVFLY